MISNVYKIAHSPIITMPSLGEARVDLQLERINPIPVYIINIKGCVRSYSKRLPRARVYLYDCKGNKICKAITNYKGYYRITSKLPAGLYKIFATHYKYKRSKVKYIKVTKSENIKICFYLCRRKWHALRCIF